MGSPELASSLIFIERSRGTRPILTALITSVTLAQASGNVTADHLPFDPSKLGDLAKVEIKVVEDGQPVTSIGVPLAVMRETRARNAGARPPCVRSPTPCSSSEGATATRRRFPPPPSAWTSRGERYVLALSRNGTSLEAGQGPVRLIVPGDSMQIRWVRDVTSIRLV